MLNIKKIYRVITIIVIIVTLFSTLFIMANKLGWVEKYDFGAGAYYYADIPNHDEIIKENVYHTSVPVWVHIFLFLSWGWLMWRLWCYIDKRQ